MRNIYLDVTLGVTQAQAKDLQNWRLLAARLWIWSMETGRNHSSHFERVQQQNAAPHNREKENDKGARKQQYQILVRTFIWRDTTLNPRRTRRLQWVVHILRMKSADHNGEEWLLHRARAQAHAQRATKRGPPRPPRVTTHPTTRGKNWSNWRMTAMYGRLWHAR